MACYKHSSIEIDIITCNHTEKCYCCHTTLNIIKTFVKFFGANGLLRRDKTAYVRF